MVRGNSLWRCLFVGTLQPIHLLLLLGLHWTCHTRLSTKIPNFGRTWLPQRFQCLGAKNWLESKMRLILTVYWQQESRGSRPTFLAAHWAQDGMKLSLCRCTRNVNSHSVLLRTPAQNYSWLCGPSNKMVVIYSLASCLLTLTALYSTMLLIGIHYKADVERTT